MLHASTALLVLLPGVLSWSTVQWSVVFLCLVAGAVEAARLASPAFAGLLVRAVPVYRESETRRLSGGFWLTLGYAVAVWLPSVGARGATAGIAVAALADPAASLIGSAVSRSPGKSWTGTAAAVVVAAATLAVLALPVRTIVIGAVLAALVERVPAPLDDNLFIAPTVALVVSNLA